MKERTKTIIMGVALALCLGLILVGILFFKINEDLLGLLFFALAGALSLTVVKAISEDPKYLSKMHLDSVRDN